MKYGESTFDILYLLLAIISGFVIMAKARNRTEKLMGFAVLILGCGDTFHLVPRVLNYFINADLSAAMGIGKLITSITMTVFYVLLYYIRLGYYEVTEKKAFSVAVWLLAAVRIAICAFPQNGWIENSNDLMWGIIRNVPFVMLGALICFLYFKSRNETRRFKSVWAYILLSFTFYVPVIIGSGVIPILGMLMLPKTVCYIFIILTFLFAITKDCSGKNQ